MIYEQMEEAKKRKVAAEFYLRHDHSTEKMVERLLKETSGYRELLAEHDLPVDEQQKQWMLAEYLSNPYYPEKKIHMAVSGNKVRSKSEVLIDLGLVRNQIAFRYECELRLGEREYYPDFTILHPKTNQIIYWEHLGRADDPVYIQRNTTKLVSYLQNNILPSINLILTCETAEKPLTMEMVDACIQTYLR